jgi:hypothetical protein
VAEYIDKQALLAEYDRVHAGPAGGARKLIEEAPAADVVPVVLCGVCELHGHCYTEDVFAFARLAEENRFCAVGKVKTNAEGRRNEHEKQ